LVIGPAMVYLIAAEMVVGDVGFGYRIRLQSKLLNMSVVYPYLALLATFGFGMDYTLRWLQRKLCPWYAGGKP
jgi:NitT/TauT family transport system permease protein